MQGIFHLHVTCEKLTFLFWVLHNSSKIEKNILLFCGCWLFFYYLWDNIDIWQICKHVCSDENLYFNFTDLISQCWWSRMNHYLLSERTCDVPNINTPFGFFLTHGSQYQFLVLSAFYLSQGYFREFWFFINQ